jgi:menaquinone-9 beta-reductase
MSMLQGSSPTASWRAMSSSGVADKYDAIVLGAGPAGSAAALMLARSGWTVALVEKANFPRRKVCGEFLSATNLPLLFALGVGDAFLRHAGPEVRRVGLFAGDTVLASPMPKASSTHGTWGRALGREHLDLLLLEAALNAGARLWQPWTATLLDYRDEGWGCRIEGRRGSIEIIAPIVIAATGSWERGPLAIEQARPRRASDLLAFKAHFRNCKLPPDLMPLLVFPGGYGGMVHSDGGRVSLSCCIRRDVLRHCRGQGHRRAGEAVLEHILGSCVGARRALRSASLDGAWLAAGPIDPGMRKAYSNGIFLVGNLAGEAHPIIAEGISMAIQSAWLLCRLLMERHGAHGAEPAIADVGHLYAAQWRWNFATRIRAAATFAHLAMRPHAAGLLLPIVKRVPGVLTLGAALSGKTKQLLAAN